MAVDWSQLPSDLLDSISRKLTLYTDRIRFRAVCRAWRSAAPETPDHLPPQLPWLLLPAFRPANRNSSSSGYFYSLLDHRVHMLRLSITEMSPRKRRCGSSHGWLVVLEESSPAVLLVNPLTRAEVILPPLHAFPDVVGFDFADVGREYSLRGGGHQHQLVVKRSLKYMRDCFVKKVVLSSSPSKDDRFAALAILNHGNGLAYCRNGDERWRLIEGASSFCEDVIYRDGLFYAVNRFGLIAVCDVRNHDSPSVSYIETPRHLGGDIQYLVSAGEELMLVTRHLDSDFVSEVGQPIYRTVLFDVFKLDRDKPRWQWVANLDDYMIFVGQNSSIALLASDFPGCNGNCVYYTDDYSDSNYDGFFEEQDTGIYRLGDGSIERLPSYSPDLAPRSIPLIWLLPNPC